VARLLVVIVAVAVLIVASLATRRETPTTIVESVEAPAKAGLLDEVDVLLAERTAMFPGCVAGNVDDDLDARKSEWEQQQRRMVSVLEASADAEHLLVVALLSRRDDFDGALLILGEAAARDPGNPLIASRILELCMDIDHCNRARPEMEDKLIAADKANVMAWVQVARSRLQRGDEAGALSALREAVAAGMVDDYLVDYVMLFDRALAASSDLPAHERMGLAFGFGTGEFSGAFSISSDCRERAENSAEWGDVCLRLGERFEHDARTLLTKGVGLGMQVSMYEIGGDTRSREQVQTRQQDFRESYRSLSIQSSRAIELKDATVFRKYVEILATGGELEAMRYLADEVSARLPPAADEKQPACPDP